MAQQFWLGLDDGPGGTNLLDRGRITVLNRGFSAPPLADGMRVRAVTLQLRLSGASDYTWQMVRDELNALLTEIEAAARRRHRTSGVLSITLDGETWTYIDVVRGVLEITEILPRGRDAFATLTLTCLPLFRGAPMQAQNLLAAPCDPEDAAWTLTNVTATSNAAIAPDGSQTAARLRETSATGMHELVQGIAKDSASETYTLSVYVKGDGRSAVSLYLADGSGTNGAYVGFDVAAGYRLYPANVTGTGFSAPDASIEPVGDGWYRCILTATSNADTALRAYIQLHDGSGTSYAGDIGKGLLVWGAQLEEGGSAGLLLVPLMLPDTIQSGYTIPGYSYEETEEITDYSLDPNNLYSGSWSESAMTETTGQADPSGGTGASLEQESSGTAIHYFTSSGTTVNTSAKATVAFYMKASGVTTPTLAFSQTGDPLTNGVRFTVDLTDGTFGTATTSGSGYTLDSREVIDMGGGWWWIRVTLNIGVTGTLAMRIYPFSMGSRAGNTSYGVVVWRMQVVNGDTIQKPKRTETTEIVVPDEVVPPETIATGKLSGAYVYGVPGDAPAIYRIEVDDESEGVAVNRLHVGAWSGQQVMLGALAPFSLLDAADGADEINGTSQVGEVTPSRIVSPTWVPVATLTLDDVVGPRGWFGVVARVRDHSILLSQPGSVEVSKRDGISYEQVKLVPRRTMVPLSSITLGIPQTAPGATLVLEAQWLSNPSTPGVASISADGGVTWQVLHPAASTTVNTLRAMASWYCPNAAALSETLTISWSHPVTLATVSLGQIIGAADDPLDQTDVDIVDAREASNMSGFASVTTTQAAELILATGLGLMLWNSPITIPVSDPRWNSGSSLSSGSIMWMTTAETGTYSLRWQRPTFGGEPVLESWLNVMSSWKAAASSGADLTPGLWSIVVTAIAEDGTESLPTGQVAVNVSSASTAVTVRWTPPAVGTPSGYRIYRNHGTGSAYAEVDDATFEYTFLAEDSLTSADPPSTSPPVIAWRLSVSLPSGQTLWRALTSVQSRIANGTWEDLPLGDVPLPPIPAGEDETPDGAMLTVEAAHIRGAQGDVNGLWLMDRASGQMIAYRDRLDATNPVGWTVETNRDEISAAWFRDNTGAETGQAVIEPGVLTLWPGNAVVSIRPEVAGGESDLARSDLQVRRVVVTPRFGWLRGRR